jgi:spermidine synthase/tetratricopeptide (TPR) repeat protein
VGKRVGEVYASNTVGCVLGSFTAGFVMVPLLGLRDSFLVVLAVGFFVGTGLIFLSEKRRAVLGTPVAVLSVVILVVAILGVPRDVFLNTMNTYHYPSNIIYIKDDVTGTITVHDLPDGNRFIAVDGVDVAGVSFMLRTTQKLQGYVPLLVHSDPKKVLQIGFGSGETSRVGLAFGVDQYTIVEICPAIFKAGKFFEDINKGSYKDPRLRKIIMDGKNFVKLTDEKFDIIMNDSTYPGTTGSSALYTYDHFQQCRRHLRPGGVLSCWVPLDLQPKDFQLVIRSFQAVMPHSSLWMINNCLNKHAVLLGTLSPMQIDFKRIKEVLERPDVSSDLATINIHSAFDLLDCLVVDENALQRIAGIGPLNTDDNPSLEFGASIKRDLDKCLETVLRWLTQNHSPILPYVVNLGDTEQESQQTKTVLEQYYAGTGHALLGLLGILEGDPVVMNHAFDLARKANPQDRDIESCRAEIRTEIKALTKAVERKPGNVLLRYRLAQRYLLQRDYERAAEQYRIFLELQPGNAGAWNNLGLCYKGLQRHEDAVWAFKKAIERDARMIPAYHNLGDALRELGNFSAAVRNYQNILSLTSGLQKIYAYDKLAQTYYMQNDYAGALSMLNEALKLAPMDSGIHKHLQDRKQFVMRAVEEKQP